jgi:hypothetical protein
MHSLSRRLDPSVLQNQIYQYYTYIAVLSILCGLAAGVSISTQDSIVYAAETSDEDKSFLSSYLHTYNLKLGNKNYPIKYNIQGGEVRNMTAGGTDVLIIYLNASESGNIDLEFPGDLSILKQFSVNFEKGSQLTKISGLVHFPKFLLKNIRELQSANYAAASIREPTRANTSSTLPLGTNFSTSNLTLSEVPQKLSFVDPGFNKNDLTLRALIIGNNVTIKRDYQKGAAEVDDWNPVLIFEVPADKPIKVGLVNVRNLIISPIKLYNSPEHMMKSVQYWKNVPLNEEIVLRLDSRTDGAIIAQVQFQDGSSALYAGGLNADMTRSKSDATEFFNRDRPFDRKLVIKESPLPIDLQSSADSNFWTAAQDILCTISKSSGFIVCN